METFRLIIIGPWEDPSKSICRQIPSRRLSYHIWDTQGSKASHDMCGGSVCKVNRRVFTSANACVITGIKQYHSCTCDHILAWGGQVEATPSKGLPRHFSCAL